MDGSVKERAEGLLRKKDFDLLLDLCENDRRFWHEVRFRLYDLDEDVRWAAIETAAKLMRLWWYAGREEKVRMYVRTLFWSMTDESGGIGWSAPQVIAETIFQIPELIDPYGSMMIAYAIDETPLVRGCLWGIGRLGPRLKESVVFFEEKVLAVFQLDEDETLGLAAWAMGEVGFLHALPFLKKLRSRTEPVQIYIDGQFRRKIVDQWVQEAIAKIGQVRQK